MAGLFSLLGLDNSGTPFTLDDETKQKIADAGLLGSLYGPGYNMNGSTDTNSDTSSQDNTNSDVQSSPDAATANDTNRDTSKAVKQVDNNSAWATLFGLDPNNYPIQDQSNTEPGNNAAVSQESDNSEQTASGTPISDESAAATANQPQVSNAGSGTSSSTDTQPGFFSKLLAGLSNPNVSQSLLAGGLATLAANNGSQPGTAAFGQGAITGINQYNTLRQQQAANALAAYKAQQEGLLNQSTIAKNLADVNQIRANTGKTITDTQVAQFQLDHPEIKWQDTGTNLVGTNKDGQIVTTIPKTQIVTTSAGQTVNSISGNGTNAPTVNPIASGGTPLEIKQTAIKTANDASQTAAQAQNQATQFDQAIKYFNSPEAADDWSNQGGLKGKASALMQKYGLAANTGTLISNQLTSQNITNAFQSAPTGSRLDRAVQNELVGNAAAFNQLTIPQKTYFLNYLKQQAQTQATVANNTATWANYAGQNGDASVASQDYKDQNGKVIIPKGTTQSAFLNQGASPTTVSQQATNANQQQTQNNQPKGTAAAPFAQTNGDLTKLKQQGFKYFTGSDGKQYQIK